MKRCNRCVLSTVFILSTVGYAEAGTVHVAPGTYTVGVQAEANSGVLDFNGKTVNFIGYSANGSYPWSALATDGSKSLNTVLVNNQDQSTVALVKFIQPATSQVIGLGVDSLFHGFVLDFDQNDGILLHEGASGVVITNNVLHVSTASKAAISIPANANINGAKIGDLNAGTGNWFLGAGLAIEVMNNSTNGLEIVIANNNIESDGGLDVGVLENVTVTAVGNWWGSYGGAGVNDSVRNAASVINNSGGGLNASGHVMGRFGWQSFTSDGNLANVAVAWEANGSGADSTGNALTDAVNTDDDFDARLDVLEVLAGSDPLDANSFPQATFAFGEGDFDPNPVAGTEKSFSVTVSNVLHIADDLPLLLRATFEKDGELFSQVFEFATASPARTGQFETTGGEADYNPYNGNDSFALDFAFDSTTLGDAFNNGGVTTEYVATFAEANEYTLKLTLVAFDGNGNVDLLIDGVGGVKSQFFTVSDPAPEHVFVATDWVLHGAQGYVDEAPAQRPTHDGLKVKSGFWGVSTDIDTVTIEFFLGVNAFFDIQEAINTVE